MNCNHEYPRPARAVSASDNSRRADGDGRETAGIPLDGVEATSAFGSHKCETPHRHQSRGADVDPSMSRVSRTSRHRNGRAAQPPGNTGELGNAPPREGGLAARRTTNPPVNTSPDVKLKKRAFRIGTWNTRGKVNPSGESKFSTAKMIMKLEKVDILVLTETHTENESPPDVRGLKVLGHTGISSHRAGVAICALDNRGWSCLSADILIPGYAIICHLYHSISTESFRVLGVYGDISEHAARVNFYTKLYGSISDHILALHMAGLDINSRDQTKSKIWNGCIAAGDWNFIESDEDRSPMKAPSGTTRECRRIFNDIKSICMLVDASGHGGSRLRHTFEQNARGTHIRSRLDRIYHPRSGWKSSIPAPIRTNHSDHFFVWADCYLTNPRVEIAVPAPRLPGVERLSCEFWSHVMTDWVQLTSHAVDLPSWTNFKKRALQHGLADAKARKLTNNDRWKEILRGEEISPDDLQNMTFDWSTRNAADSTISDSPRPGTNIGKARTVCTRKVVLYPDVARGTPRAETPGIPRKVGGLPSVADQLDIRIQAKRKAQLKKFRDMEKYHTTEWYQLSSNKEADERGSRASISVEGLRRPGSTNATTDLKQMLHIAHDHFRDLHSFQVPSDRRRELQRQLLAEVSREYRCKPAPADRRSGDFTLKEILELKKKMPNTAPGPDGIQYGFYKRLAARIDTAIKNGAEITSFWDAFTGLSNDIKRNGSSRCHFKLANLSLFYKKGDPTLVSNYRPISSMNTDCKMYTNLINGRISPWAVTKIHPDQAGFVPGRLITDHTRLAAEVAHLSDRSNTDGYLISLDQAKAYDRTDTAWMLRVLEAMGVPDELISDIRNITSHCRTRVRINSGLSAVYSLGVGLRQGDPLSPILYDFSIEPLGMRMRGCMTGITCYGLDPAKIIQYADDINLFASKNENFPRIKATMRDTSTAIGNKINLDKTSVLVVGSKQHKESPSHLPVTECFDGAVILPAGAPLRVLGVWVGSQDRATHRWKQVLSHIKLLVRQWNAIGASILNRVLLAKALMLSRCYYLLDGNGIPPVILRKINNAVQRFVRGAYSSAPYSLLERPLAEGGLNCPSLRSRVLAYDSKLFSDLISGEQLTAWKRWTMTDLDQASVFNSSSKKDAFPGALNPLLQSCHCRYTMLEPRVRDAWKSLRTLRYDVRCSFPSEEAVMDMPSILHPSRRTYQLSKLKCIISANLLKVRDLINFSVPSNTRNRPAPFSGRFIRHEDSSSESDDYRPPKVTGRPRAPQTKLRSRIKGVKKLPPGRGTDLRLAGPMSRNLLQDLDDTRWSPKSNKPTNQRLDRSLRIWPKMANALGCARLFTGHHSMLAHSKIIRDWTPEQLLNNPSKFGPYPAHDVATHDDFPPTSLDTIHLWTDGSAFDNGLDSCAAGAAWVSSHGAEYSTRITNGPVSNNVAEVVAIIISLLSWRHTDLIIHTDSKYVIQLINGGLLAMERDGWVNDRLSLQPPNDWAGLDPTKMPDSVSSALMFKYLLYLLRSHDGGISFRWVKAHDGDINNSRADELAKAAALSNLHKFSLASMRLPDNWVDTGPVLNYQSVQSLTEVIINKQSVLPSLCDKSLPFRLSWNEWAIGENGAWMDVTHHIPNIWTINVPPQLRELMWKEINGSLPLGNSWSSRIQIGQLCPCNDTVVDYRHVWVSPRCDATNGLRAIKCRCGSTVSLAHIWKGCASYDMAPFREAARTLIKGVVYLDTPTTDPDRWMSGDMWYPLLSLRSLEHGPAYDEKARRILGPSRKAREWIMGAMLWFTWRMRMKESHSSSMMFTPRDADYINPLLEKCKEYQPTAKERRYAAVDRPPVQRQRR